MLVAVVAAVPHIHLKLSAVLDNHLADLVVAAALIKTTPRMVGQEMVMAITAVMLVG